MKIKSYKQFLKENVSVDSDEPVIYLRVQQDLINTMLPLIKDYKVAKLLYELSKGILRKNLSNEYADFIKIENDGYISYLKPKYWGETDVWNTVRRVSQKATKALKEIYNIDYLNDILTPKDFEDFLIKMATLYSPAKVEEYRGKELLRAYNYKKELNSRFGHSCANFNQIDLGGSYKEPKLEEYNIWVKNPDNCGVVVVWDKGDIVARRSFQQGIQVCDSGTWKTGEFHTIWGNFYGIGAYGKYDKMITDYLVKKYPNACHRAGGEGSFCIKMETRWEIYPAFDQMYVCFEHNLLTDNPMGLPEPFKSYKWDHTYTDQNNHLKAPKEFLNIRNKEKKLNKTIF